VTDRERIPNELLRRARGGLSQATLAELVNAEIYRATGRVSAISSKSISDWERGWYSWPSADVRDALCHVLKKSKAAELGFEKRRTRRPEQQSAVSVPILDLLGDYRPSDGISGLSLPAGRSYAGVEVAAHYCEAERAGSSWLMVDPGREVTASLRRPDRRSMVMVVDREQRMYISDGRRFVDRAGPRTGPQPVSSANVIDDLTVGIIWATTNADTALLADDAALAKAQVLLAHHENKTASEAMLTEVPMLGPLPSQWLGSRFCARHITRNLDRLWGRPVFWTRERRGEEAASWLLWAHKYEYLRRTSRWFRGMRRGFCIPEEDVAASPRYERVMLLLAIALMEAFGITVELSVEPEHGDVEGFVLANDAIVANWLGGSGLWYVDASAPAHRRADYREIAGHLAAESLIAQPTSALRLAAMASYLNVPWQWFLRRCEELAVAGIDDIAHPRSRLLSTRGLNTAIRYVAYVDTLEGADLAGR
jgi:transcriptional regulator with XRE-family HTH domain